MDKIHPLQFIKEMCLKQDLKGALNGTPISVWFDGDSTLVNVIIPHDEQEPLVQFTDRGNKQPQEINDIPLSELGRDEVDKIVYAIIAKCEDIGDKYISWLA